MGDTVFGAASVGNGVTGKGDGRPTGKGDGRPAPGVGANVLFVPRISNPSDWALVIPTVVVDRNRMV